MDGDPCGCCYNPCKHSRLEGVLLYGGLGGPGWVDGVGTYVDRALTPRMRQWDGKQKISFVFYIFPFGAVHRLGGACDGVGRRRRGVLQIYLDHMESHVCGWWVNGG